MARTHHNNKKAIYLGLVEALYCDAGMGVAEVSREIGDLSEQSINNWIKEEPGWKTRHRQAIKNRNRKERLRAVVTMLREEEMFYSARLSSIRQALRKLENQV